MDYYFVNRYFLKGDTAVIEFRDEFIDDNTKNIIKKRFIFLAEHYDNLNYPSFFKGIEYNLRIQKRFYTTYNKKFYTVQRARVLLIEKY